MRRAGDLFAAVLSKFGLGGALAILLGFGAFYLLQTQRAGDLSIAAQGAEQAADDQVQFAVFVLDDVQVTWEHLFPTYRRAKLVIFSGPTRTACGYGARAVGPFYCPRDGNVYLDLAFFKTLGAAGDFAQANVLAHEIGHHVQRQLGLESRGIEYELQADCFAGVWARASEQHRLFDGADLFAAMSATALLGDQQRGAVRPESWTWGSPAQRALWFLRGFQAGEPRACDTAPR